MKLGDLDSITLDPDLEGGRWIEDLFGRGVRIKVRRWGNPEYLAKLEELREPYAAMIEADRNYRIPAKDWHWIQSQAMAHAILVELEEDGKHDEGSRAATLEDPRFGLLRQRVIQESSAEEAYLVRLDEATVGNS